MRLEHRAVACAFATIFAGSGVAHAAGFASARFGGEQGSVVATNPTALYFNPAGIGFSEGTHVYLDGELALRHATYDHPTAPSDPADRPGDEGANSGSARLFNVFGGPALGVTTRIGDFALGAGVFVPFGGQATWSASDHFSNPMHPLASAGVQRWHIIDGALAEIYFTAGAAYRMGPLSLGVAGNFITGSAKTTVGQSPFGVGVPDTQREGRATLDVSGNTASFAAGAMLEAVPKRLWLSASYQSQPGLGPQTMKGTLNIDYNGVMPFNVKFQQALPDIVRLGVRWRPSEDGELRLFGDYTRWSVLKSQCIFIDTTECQVYPDGSIPRNGGVQSYVRRDFKDTVGVRLGGSYWASREVELFTGAGYETAAVPDATLEPGLMDADNIAVALGGRFLVADWFYLAASYTQIEYLNRDNIGKSILAAAAKPTKQQDAGGIYTQWIGLFDLNVERQF